jgi:hypothetical protein
MSGNVWTMVNALHQGNPCSICGLRFTVRKEHDDHMDWHSKQNRESKNRLHNEKKCPRTFKHVTAEVNKE